MKFALTDAAAMVTALGVILGAVVLVYRIAKRLEQAVGVDKQGRTLADRVQKIEHQVFPNGGASLADQVRNMAQDQAELRAEVRVIRDLLTTLVETSARDH